MPPLTVSPDQVASLAEGRAVVALDDLRLVRVTGVDARSWLHDLLTGDVASLEPGQAGRSLFLDPRGHLRADVHVVADADEALWLWQAPGQPVAIDEALARYVLSSDVTLDDRSAIHTVLAGPGGVAPDGATVPSILGRGGGDVLAARGATSLTGRRTVEARVAEAGRILDGRARLGLDLDATSIPAEAGLDAAIDIAKGCFLGQESVARVRELGHPPRIVLHLRAETVVDVGTGVVDPDGTWVGTVTSAASWQGGTVTLAGVRWSARALPLRTEEGVSLTPVGPLD